MTSHGRGGRGVPPGVAVGDGVAGGVGVGTGVGLGDGVAVGIGVGVPTGPNRTNSVRLSEPFETPFRL